MDCRWISLSSSWRASRDEATERGRKLQSVALISLAEFARHQSGRPPRGQPGRGNREAGAFSAAADRARLGFPDGSWTFATEPPKCRATDPRRTVRCDSAGNGASPDAATASPLPAILNPRCAASRPESRKWRRKGLKRLKSRSEMAPRRPPQGGPCGNRSSPRDWRPLPQWTGCSLAGWRRRASISGVAFFDLGCT